MPSSRKPSSSKGKSNKGKDNPLDEEQRQLREQQAALEAKIASLQQSIKEAPQKAAEERRRRVEAVQAATPRRGAYIHGASLVDTRHVEAAAASGRMRPGNARRKPVMLREERKAGRQQTLFLVIAVLVALCWALGHYLL